MGRGLHRLTPKWDQKTNEPGLYADGGCLYLQVTDRKDGDGCTKAWLFRFQLDGRTRHMGFGSALTVTLKEARRKAAEARKLLVDGIDPLEERRARLAQRKVSVSFSQCGERYIDAHKSAWKNAKHAQQWANTLKQYAYPKLGKLPVDSIDTKLVLSVLSPIWTDKTETAGRLRQRIEAVLDWARVAGHRSGENPARWKGHLDKLLAKPTKVKTVRRHPALPYREIAAFMQSLRQQEGTAAAALEFAILTACRTGEVLHATPSEFDLEQAVWRIPPERMKTGKSHTVPLSSPALAIVRDRMDGTFVFPGRYRNGSGPLNSSAMLCLLKKMGHTCTVHGFRSSFRDWCAEQSNFPREVAEAALAHAVGNQTEQAYLRSELLEKRRLLMEAWANYINTPKGSVVQIRKGRGAA